MTTFLKSQQAKIESFESFFAGLEAWEEKDCTRLYANMVIAQTIKATTARVREVMGEEKDYESVINIPEINRAEGYNDCRSKVTQELNSLEEN